MRTIEEFKEEITQRSQVKAKRNKRRNIAVISTCCLLVVCVVCAAVLIPPRGPVGRNNYNYTRPEGRDLMASLKPVALGTKAAPDAGAKELADFALRLFKATAKDGENTLVSPLSAIAVLGMVANGAGGETLSQMEKVFGLPVDKLNDYLHSYVGSLPQSAGKYKLDMANSIWFRDDGSLKVNQDFLQKNADYYGAAAYAEPFDAETVKNINDWVKKNTDGMIEKIIDDINPSEVMHLINALAFDAYWETPYKSHQLLNTTFNGRHGSTDKVLMMNSTESVYYSGEGFEGVGKPYKDGKYSFVALLPEMGSSVEDLVSSLDGAKLYEILSSPQKEFRVETQIPKFEIEYEAQLGDALKAMGMKDLFDSDLADLSGIGRSAAGKLFIGSVIQKTYISVDENGTKAAAATDAIAYATGFDPNLKFVILDRPFLYMLVDNQTNTPFFIGTVMDIEK